MRVFAAAAAAKSLQSCPIQCDPIDGSPPGPPSLGFSRQESWSGLPFRFQCMKVKSEREVAQSCPTPSDPMDCNIPGFSIHGVGCHALYKIRIIMITTLQVRKLRHRDIKDGPGDLLHLFSCAFWVGLSSWQEPRGLCIHV